MTTLTTSSTTLEPPPTSTTRLTALRAELKAWEKAFASTHAGRKATRDEIKADAFIAGRYKEYNRLREQATTNTLKRKSTSESEAPVAEAVDGAPGTPAKRARTVPATPRRDVEHVDGEAATPVVVRTLVGPTPQKDGLVLGLFDGLENECAATPPRQQNSARQALAEQDANITPRSARSTNHLSTPQTGARHRFARTPRSASRRYLWDEFVTPSKRRHFCASATKLADVGEEEPATPVFLQRYARKVEASPSKGGKDGRRRVLGRSLSEMIRDLRRVEDERLDDELDMLREVEGGESLCTAADVKPSNTTAAEHDETALLGPDGTHPASDAETSTETQQRTWKKKGQRRTTRRVLMRPRAKPARPLDVQDGARDGASSSDEQTAEHGARDDKPAQTIPQDKQGVIHKTARKVSEAAHANFRRLKIRSKNAGAGGARWGRRR